MNAYAEHAFRHSTIQPDGASLGDTLASGAEQMRKFGLKPKQAIESPDGPPFPIPLVYLWRWYTELSAGLPINGMVMPMVTWESLAAWSHITRNRLEMWEANALIGLGAIRANVQMKKK